jgi:hypothetical protein
MDPQAGAILLLFAQVLAIGGILTLPIGIVVGVLKSLPLGIPQGYFRIMAIFAGAVFGLIVGLITPGGPALVICIAAGTVSGYGTSKAYASAKAANPH